MRNNPTEVRQIATNVDKHLDEVQAALTKIKTAAEELSHSGIVSTFGTAARQSADEVVRKGVHAKNRGNSVTQALRDNAQKQEEQNNQGKSKLPQA